MVSERVKISCEGMEIKQPVPPVTTDNTPDRTILALVYTLAGITMTLH